MKHASPDNERPARQPGAASQIALLCAGAFALNCVRLPLHFGIDFLFGSIFVLLAAWRFGPLWGAFVALVGSVPTLVLWGHGGGAAIYVAEAVAVGTLARRFGWSLILLDGLFWLCAIPLTFVIYRELLDWSGSQTYLVFVKSAVNGLFNALVASALLHWLGRRFQASQKNGGVPLAHKIFDVLVGCVLVPTILFSVVTGWQTRARLERGMDTELRSSSALMTDVVRRWHRTHLDALRSIVARYNEDADGRSDAEWQNDLAFVARSLPDFSGIYAADAKGRAFAFHPKKTRRGTPTIGLSFADRDYFKTIKKTKRDFTSGALRGRIRDYGTVVPIAVPFFRKKQWRGYVSGGLDLKYGKQVLKSSLPQGGVVATLVDNSGLVLASTRDELKIGARYDRPGASDERIYQWAPASGALAPIQRWNGSFRILQAPVGGGIPWKIYIESPYSVPQRDLENVYAFNLSTALALLAAALGLASLLGAALSRPLNDLARVTTDLPSQLSGQDAAEHAWPRSDVREIDTLVRNFREMETSLRGTLHAGDAARAELESERARLYEANRLKDDFLAVLSHELRTPLVPVLGYADLIARGVLKGDDATEGALSIERNARAQLRLIEDLLDVSSIMSGKMRLQMGIVNVPVVVREAGETMRTRAHDADVGMFFELDETTPYLWGDAARIRQIVWNLLSNSLKFTPYGGSVRITLTHDTKNLTLSVADTGMGIEPDFLPRVFDRFRQAGDHLTRPAGGLGLGLAIVQHFVELHEGTITAASEGEDLGATFTVVLPLRPIPTDTISTLPPL